MLMIVFFFWGGGCVCTCSNKNIKTRMWTKSNYISSWVVQLEAGRSIMGEQIDVKNANTKFYVCANHLSQKKKRQETRKPCCCFSFTLITIVLSSPFIFSTSVVTVPWLRWCCWLRSKHYNIGASVETLCCFLLTCLPPGCHVQCFDVSFSNCIISWIIYFP